MVREPDRAVTAHTDAIVGREAELRRLADALDGGRSAGGAVILEGEAGIGKTVLLQAAIERARADGFAIMHATVSEIDRHRPFHVISALLGGLPSDRLGRADVDEPGFLEFRIAEIITDRVETVCAERPLLLAVDDLHWADPLSVSVLAQLLRDADDLPVLFVVTARPLPRDAPTARLLHELGRRGRAIALGPLDGNDTVRLVGTLVAAEPGPALVRQTHGAAGNPLYVVELVRSLEELGAIVRRDGRADLEGDTGPASLSLAVLQRLSLLSAETFDILALGAVIGSSFTASDVAAATGRRAAELLAPLREAIRAGILRDEAGALVFRHELIRNTLYEDLPESLRRDLHADLARTLLRTGDSDAAAAAVHLARAGTTEDPDSARALHRVAQKTMAGAPAAAIELLEHARSLCSPAESARSGIDGDLALSMVLAGHPDGEAIARRVLADPAASADRELLQLSMAEIALLRRGLIDDALVELDALLGAPYLDRLGTPARALRALCLAMSTDMDAAAAASAEALAQAEAADDQASRCRAMIAAAFVRAHTGELAVAYDMLTTAVEIADRLWNRDVHGSLPHVARAHFANRLGLFEESRRDLETGRRLCESVGCRIHMALYDLMGCEAAYCAGLWDQVLVEAESCRQSAEATGTGWTAAVEVLVAAIAMYRGDLDAAREALHEAERTVNSSEQTAGWVYWVQAMITQAADGARAAVPLVRERWVSMLTAQAPTTAATSVVRLLLAGDDRETAEVVTQTLEFLAANAGRYDAVVAAAKWCRALMDGSAAAAAEAARELGRTRFALQHAQACEDAAVLYAEAHDAAPARAMARAALDGYERLGADRTARRAEQRFRDAGLRLGGSPGERRRPATGWASLTVTERRVARLAAEGRTNAEIADELFVSRHTVHTHVAHVLAKLGIASRVELAALHARRSAEQL
jgi:DNA-binding CsgD family transcriptional regulator